MRSVLLVVACAAAATGVRADGMLDPAFGMGGIVRENIASNDGLFEMVVTPSGTIVAAGTSSSLIPNPFRFMVAMRLLPSGALDPSFGPGGRVIVEFQPGADAMGAGLVLQPDGKVVIAGGMAPLGTAVYQVALVRLGIDGSLDPSFGSGGRVFATCPGGDCLASGIALQPDGKIVVVVRSDGQGGRLLRFLADGTLDPSFGTGGVAAIPPAWILFASEVAVHAGRIVLAGTIGGPPGAADLAAARFLEDGTPDVTFDGDGLAAYAFPNDQGANQLIAQESGAVIVGGVSALPGPPSASALVRFLPDGTPDAGFGTGGIATVGSGGAGAVLELPNGNLVQAGSTPGPVGSTPDVALVRYLPNGTIDPTFGTAGTLKIDLGGRDFAGALAYAGPERILVGGSSELLGSLTGADFAFARVIATTPVALQSFAVE